MQKIIFLFSSHVTQKNVQIDIYMFDVIDLEAVLVEIKSPSTHCIHQNR